MRWIGTEVAWEAQGLSVEAAHEMVAAGRRCHAASCSARSELAFSIEHEGRAWAVGFCLGHAVVFAVEHADTIRGLPRRLEPDEALHGPVAEGDGDEGDD